MEENNNKKITIADVAKLAGVSKGTVDRVLHDRGGVSRKSMEKIRQVIDELGYEPNVYASMLATRRDHSIACILPESEKDDYWYLVREGFEKGGENISSMNISTRLFYYDQYSPESFRKACLQMLETNPSGVVLPPFSRMTHIHLSIPLPCAISLTCTWTQSSRTTTILPITACPCTRAGTCVPIC